MVKKRGLGRGLGALIPQELSEEIVEEKEFRKVIQLDINSIRAREGQPRKIFEEKALRELKDSIEKYGIIQPILVQKVEDHYEIVAGERRYRAAQLAGFKEIPAIERELDERTTREMSLIENIQREDLNPIEEGLAYKELMGHYSMTQQELSESVGKSRSYIANTVRLLNLDEKSLSYLERGELTSSQGRALLAIENLKEREKFLYRLIGKKSNVREVEEASRNKRKKISKRDIYVEEFEERLSEGFGTKVRIREKGKGGNLIIEYYNEEDLERILRLVEADE